MHCGVGVQTQQPLPLQYYCAFTHLETYLRSKCAICKCSPTKCRVGGIDNFPQGAVSFMQCHVRQECWYYHHITHTASEALYTTLLHLTSQYSIVTAANNFLMKPQQFKRYTNLMDKRCPSHAKLHKKTWKTLFQTSHEQLNYITIFCEIKQLCSDIYNFQSHNYNTILMPQ